jgi:hypothetical protein
MIQVVYRFIRHGTHGVAPSLPHHVSAPENCVWECKQVQTPQTNDDHRNKRRPVGCCLLLCQRNTLTPSGKPSDSKHHRSMSGAQSSWFRNFPSPSPQTFSATPVPHRSVTMALPRSNHSCITCSYTNHTRWDPAAKSPGLPLSALPHRVSSTSLIISILLLASNQLLTLPPQLRSSTFPGTHLVCPPTSDRPSIENNGKRSLLSNASWSIRCYIQPCKRRIPTV